MVQKSFSTSKTIARSFVWAAALALSSVGCAGVQPTVPLERTHWKLIEVEGAPSVASIGGREPYIVFDAEKRRVTGYSGVNSFFGGYDTRGGGLRMPRLASTRRAGTPALMQLESAFFKALTATRSYRVSDDELELLDGGGRTIARFRAERVVPSTMEK